MSLEQKILSLLRILKRNLDFLISHFNCLQRYYECSLRGKSNDQTTHATHKSEESSMCQCKANLFYKVTSVKKN